VLVATRPCAACLGIWDKFLSLFLPTGATFVSKPSFLFDSSKVLSLNHTGVMCGMGASIVGGLSFLFVRILGTSAKMPPGHVVFVQALGQMFLALPFMHFSGQHFNLSLAPHQYALMIVGSICGACAQLLQTAGVQSTKSATATSMRMSDIVFGFVFQSIITHDDVSFLSLIGAVLVASSILVVLITFKKADKEPSVVTPSASSPSGGSSSDPALNSSSSSAATTALSSFSSSSSSSSSLSSSSNPSLARSGFTPASPSPPPYPSSPVARASLPLTVVKLSDTNLEARWEPVSAARSFGSLDNRFRSPHASQRTSPQLCPPSSHSLALTGGVAVTVGGAQ
jgi:hypothetical protein